MKKRLKSLLAISIKVYFSIISFFKDVFYTFSNLTKEDLLDIIEIVCFGLVINSLYGLANSLNLVDFTLFIISLYGALKSRQSKRI